MTATRPTGWMWSFGDGHQSTDRHAEHTYTADGEYPVTLTVTDNGGLTAAKTLPMVVVVTGIDEAAAVTEFRLHGAYPNPFNPSTVIRFDIPMAGDVVIEVVSMSGHRVAMRELRGLGAGPHRVAMDAGRWPSGVYLYRVSYGKETLSGKMTLLK